MEDKKLSIGAALVRLRELLVDREAHIYDCEWVSKEWAEQHFGDRAEAEMVSLLTPEVVAYLMNIPLKGHPDYANYNVRGNPNMQAAYEDTYETPWVEGNPRSRMHFALGYARALGHQVLRIEEPQLEHLRELKDNCQVCLGESGGVRGNENRIEGLVVCDYCHVKMSNGIAKSPDVPYDFPTARTHNTFTWDNKLCLVANCVWCQRREDAS